MRRTAVASDVSCRAWDCSVLDGGDGGAVRLDTAIHYASSVIVAVVVVAVRVAVVVAVMSIRSEPAQDLR